jgi:hypothetical protein
LDKEKYVLNEKVKGLGELELVNNKNLPQTGGNKQQQNTYVKYSIHTYFFHSFSLNFFSP